MTHSFITVSAVLSVACIIVTSGQYFPFHPSQFFLPPQPMIPFPYSHAAALQSRMSSPASAAAPFTFNPYAAAPSMAPVAVIQVPVPALPFPMITNAGAQLSQSSSSSSSSTSANSESQPEISERSSPTQKSSTTSALSPFAGFSMKSLNLPNDFADKLFPFTIRIATHGEPHLP